MRKILIIIVNIFIIAAILFSVVIYSRYESRVSYQRQIEYFENTTVTMERVTENYLEGEQRICDVWSHYINNSSMTMEEAIGFIRNSHVLENTSAHLIALDTLEGLSTRPKQDTSDDYAVSYERVGLFKDTSWISEIGDAINITRAYTNPMMGYTAEEKTSIYTLVSYPFFCSTVASDAEAVEKLNALDTSAGEYMRPTLEKMEQFLNDCSVDYDACAPIEDNYEAVILRFFEGDVPMMTCSGDTVSGTKKRESLSEEFTANPFEYTFVPIPIADDGAYFLDMPNLQFSVNKDSKNLDVANEFMRFLVTSEELNEMAKNKGLMSPTKDLSFNSMYAAFGNIPESRILSPEEIGLTDDAVVQLRMAVYDYSTGKLTIDEAIKGFGSYSQ